MYEYIYIQIYDVREFSHTFYHVDAMHRESKSVHV